MEIEKDFASKGVAGTALGLGAGALGVQLLNGGLGGLFGARTGEMCCHEDHHVNRYEASQSARIAELETEVKLRDANTFTMGEMGKLRDYVDKKFDAVNTQLCQQAVINSQTISNLSCLTNQVAMLQSLTKTVIPITSVCPEPMPQYNSWTAPTAAAAG